MRACRRSVLRGGWSAAGLIVVVVTGACGGGSDSESDIPVLEVVMDVPGSEPAFTAQDSATIQRLENGEGPVRFRMVMCDEVLVDEVVSNRDEFSEAMQRPVLEMFEGTEDSAEEMLAELQAMDPDSVVAAWEASWEAMTPAERDEFSAEMERLMPMLDVFLQDEPNPETLEETLDTLSRMYPDMREAQCEEWRKFRAELREKAGEPGEGRQ